MSANKGSNYVNPGIGSTIRNRNGKISCIPGDFCMGIALSDERLKKLHYSYIGLLMEQRNADAGLIEKERKDEFS